VVWPLAENRVCHFWVIIRDNSFDKKSYSIMNILQLEIYEKNGPNFSVHHEI